MLAELTEIVGEVGELLLSWRAAGRFDGRWEGPHQFKAQADLMAHEALTSRLSGLAPAIPIMSEENPESWSKKRPDRYWLIDPLDGTASFVQGYPGFVTQVALMENGTPILAAVYAPVLKLMYVAERSKGAFVNGERLIVQNNFPADKLIDNFPEPRGITLSAFTELGFRKYIESGSISLKICRVADGTADFFFKTVVVRDWDLAAPHLVISEMGGYLSDVHGQPIIYNEVFEKSGLIAASQRNTFCMFLDWYSKVQKRK
jgi:3'(2'), 5'-bisphosphate nucleotidase